MTIYAGGALNLAAMIVPDLAVVILPPDVSQINGQPTNIVGLVGSADWGPKNSPVAISGMGDYLRYFGLMKNRKFDMGTALAAAILQGANNFRCVRVTDGNDLAASVVVQSTCITFTSKYTGSRANADKVDISVGSQAASFRVTVLRPGQQPEVFDNLAAGLSGNAVWVAIAAAINNGVGQRGPSELIVATAGAGTAEPTIATHSLASGADGAGVTASNLIGVDTAGARTGMYALRGTGASIGVLVDNDDSTTWTTQAAFGLSEGVYMQAVAPAGAAIANGTTGTVDLKASAGIDTYAIKILHGDWCYFRDEVNQVTRLISPQGFVAGRLANLSPEQSGLNKPIYGIVGTQRSAANQNYSNAELTQLGQAKIDVITNPVPGGNFFAQRFGRNASSNATIHQDAYTRVTNFLAATLNAGMGRFVGENASADSMRETKVTLDALLENVQFAGIIGNAEGTTPFSVDCRVGVGTNNPPNRLALGYRQADVKVQYLSVTEYFIVNLQAGQSVQINQLPTSLAA